MRDELTSFNEDNIPTICEEPLTIPVPPNTCEEPETSPVGNVASI